MQAMVRSWLKRLKSEGACPEQTPGGQFAAPAVKTGADPSRPQRGLERSSLAQKSTEKQGWARPLYLPVQSCTKRLI